MGSLIMGLLIMGLWDTAWFRVCGLEFRVYSVGCRV